MSALGPGSAAWYLRTWRDLFDAHLASRCPGSRMVRARCGAEFEPAAVFTCGGLPAVQARFRPLLVQGHKALPGYPPDPEQVCPACRQERGGRDGDG